MSVPIRQTSILQFQWRAYIYECSIARWWPKLSFRQDWLIGASCQTTVSLLIHCQWKLFIFLRLMHSQYAQISLLLRKITQTLSHYLYLWSNIAPFEIYVHHLVALHSCGMELECDHTKRQENTSVVGCRPSLGKIRLPNIWMLARSRNVECRKLIVWIAVLLACPCVSVCVSVWVCAVEFIAFRKFDSREIALCGCCMQFIGKLYIISLFYCFNIIVTWR